MSLRIIACVNADGNLAGFRPPRADLQRFAALTVGGVVIMGRKTWEALPAKVRPLPHRTNVVVSRSAFPGEPGTVHANALAWAFHEFPDAWVIGGGEVYAQALTWPDVSHVYLSETADRGGSVPFPMLTLQTGWDRIMEQTHEDHRFTVWGRR